MKLINKDKVEGTFHEVRGKVKELVGKLSNKPKLEAKGKAGNMAGKTQEKVGQVNKVVKGRKLP